MVVILSLSSARLCHLPAILCCSYGVTYLDIYRDNFYILRP